jgi:PAS domain S-box-containing protein
MKNIGSKKILVIEDDHTVARFYVDVLEKCGCNSLVVTSEIEAIEAVENRPDIDLILLDIDLGSGQDGIRTAKAVLQNRDIPLLFLYSNASGDMIDKADKITSYGNIEKGSGEIGALLSIKTAFHLHDMYLKQRKHEENVLLMIRKGVESSSDAIGMSDPGGNHFYHNKAFMDMFGYTVEEITAIGGAPAIYVDSAVATEVFLAIMNGKSWTGETMFRSKAGREIPIYLRADAIKDDNNSIIGLIGVHTDITELKRAEQALRESEKKLSEVIDFLPDATLAVDKERNVIAWNRAMEEMTGVKSEDMLGKGQYEYAIPFYGARQPVLIDMAFESESSIEGNYDKIEVEGSNIEGETTVLLNGKSRVLWGKVSKLFDSNGSLAGAIEILRDVTDQRLAEQEKEKLKEQLFQSQKMETIGLLAGGVAHDFNNLLTPIIGLSELMMLNTPKENPDRQMLENIFQSAVLAKDMTGRLLAFSRKQMLDLKVTNIGDIIRGFEQMARRTIRENIEISVSIAPAVGSANADKGQIEQVLLNLSINSQDAMPDGGKLIIEAKNITLDETYASSHSEIKPGQFVLFSVSDTGIGIDEEIQERVFEPFFTTKEMGKGTGLGLATVYGIVKQHGGTISVYSKKGSGTVFQVFLPRVDEDERTNRRVSFRPDFTTQVTETVLVVEDDVSVRNITRKMLENLGYHVLVAENIDRSMEISSHYSGAIDLLLTDVIMPKTNGKELYEILRCDRPEIKVLFMSGYTGNVIDYHGILEKGFYFLQKPFTFTTLSQHVRKALQS